jgi:hypothetical protein
MFCLYFQLRRGAAISTTLQEQQENPEKLKVFYSLLCFSCDIGSLMSYGCLPCIGSLHRIGCLPTYGPLDSFG